MTMDDLLGLLKIIDYKFLFAFIGVIFSAYKYFHTKKREQDRHEFENYHRLVKELVQSKEGEHMYLDRQIAIVFEMRKL